MLYLSGAKRGTQLGVSDTDDNIEEFYTKDQLLNSGLKIYGLNIQLKEKMDFEDKYFKYVVRKEEDEGIYIEASLRRDLISESNLCPILNSSIAGIKVKNLTRCFSYSSATYIDCSKMDTRYVVTMNRMFDCCQHLERINLENIRTSNVRDMDGMFEDCIKLKYLNLSSFRTSQVRSMAYMFRRCVSLTELDLSSFSITNLKSNRGMFEGCNNIVTLDLRKFNCDFYWNEFKTLFKLKYLNIQSGSFCNTGMECLKQNMIVVAKNVKTNDITPKHNTSFLLIEDYKIPEDDLKTIVAKYSLLSKSGAYYVGREWYKLKNKEAV